MTHRTPCITFQPFQYIRSIFMHCMTKSILLAPPSQLTTWIRSKLSLLRNATSNDAPSNENGEYYCRTYFVNLWKVGTYQRFGQSHCTAEKSSHFHFTQQRQPTDYAHEPGNFISASLRTVRGCERHWLYFQAVASTPCNSTRRPAIPMSYGVAYMRGFQRLGRKGHWLCHRPNARRSYYKSIWKCWWPGETL